MFNCRHVWISVPAITVASAILVSGMPAYGSEPIVNKLAQHQSFAADPPDSQPHVRSLAGEALKAAAALLRQADSVEASPDSISQIYEARQQRIASSISEQRSPAAFRQQIREKFRTKALRGMPVSRVIRADAVNQRRLKLRLRRNQTVRSVEADDGGDLLHADAKSANQRVTSAEVLDYIDRNKAVFKLRNPKQELVRIRHTRFTDGRGVQRFRQRYNGVPIRGAELIAYESETGTLRQLGGAYLPTPSGINTVPEISAEEARQVAVEALGFSATNASLINDPALTLVPIGGDFRLVWVMHFDIRVEVVRQVTVDALTAAIIENFNTVPTNAVSGSGLDLLGISRPLEVFESAGVYYMTNASKPMTGYIEVADAANTTDDLVIDPVTAPTQNGPWTTAHGVSAAFGLSETYDYFLNEQGFNSINGSGGNVLAVVHHDADVVNAFFNPTTQRLYFGDGDIMPAALDIVAHEFVHGVISNTAGLVYLNQSGAINEAIADIFGEVVEYHTHGSADWLTGTGLSQPLRNLADPSALNYSPGQPYPERMSEYVQTGLDNGGVHINSSIINHMFYQLAVGQGNAIGVEAAANILFRALQVGLTSYSDFVDLRYAMQDAAAELFGSGSSEWEAVRQAFDSVEIIEAPANPPPEPFPPVSAADSAVTVYFNPVLGDYILGRRETALGDSSVARPLTAGSVEITKPAITGDGSAVFFVDGTNDFCAIATADPLNEECIGFPGVFSSIALSPDSAKAALVLLDTFGNPTNEISVLNIDDDTDQTYTLQAPIMDGVNAVYVQEADTLDFTADGRYLIYDALNVVSFSDGSVQGLWSVYALDLITGSTIALVEPRAGFDYVYPSIAQTSDAHITFDAYDTATGLNTIYACNVYLGECEAVAQTNDLSLPGYTGDDASIVFSQQDPFTASGYSLRRQSVLPDRITPLGSSVPWLSNAVVGVVYRRGIYTGPSNVDMTLSIGMSDQAIIGQAVEGRYYIRNEGATASGPITMNVLLPPGAHSVYLYNNELNPACIQTGNQVTCTRNNIDPGQGWYPRIDVVFDQLGEYAFSAYLSSSRYDSDTSNNFAYHSIEIIDGDNDGDNIPDSWELENGLDPNDRNDAGEDDDGDGYSNFDEYLNGTNPQIPDPPNLAPDTAITALMDASGDGVPDLAHVEEGSGTTVGIYSMSDGSKVREIEFFGNDAFQAVAIGALKDGNMDGIPGDPAIVMLARRSRDTRVRIRDAVTGEQIRHDIGYNRSFEALDLVVLEDTNGDGVTTDPSFAVLMTQTTIGGRTAVVAQKFERNTSSTVGNWTFTKPGFKPLAVESVTHAGQYSQVDVLYRDTNTGKSKIRSRRMDTGAWLPSKFAGGSARKVRDFAVLKDFDGNGVADDPAYGILVKKGNSGSNRVQYRSVATGAVLGESHLISGSWEAGSLAFLPDTDGNGYAEYATEAIRVSDGQFLLKVRDTGTTDTIHNIYH